MRACVAGGAGFLLAVLWFDLMFDVQAARGNPGPLPEDRLVSIAGYYARVTTAARPMNRLVPAVMAGMLAALAVELIDGSGARWVPWVSLPLALAPIGLAAARTVPSAVRLGTRLDDAAGQSGLARSILREHLFCLACIATLLALQMAGP